MTDQSPWVTALLAFTLVFVTLSILAAVLFGLRILARRSSFDALIKAEARAEDRELEPEILVVLAAAAHEMLGAPVVIHRVHVHRDWQPGEAWSRSGRMDIMYSHRMDRKR